MSKEKPTDDPRHTIQPGGLVMKSTIVIMEVKERGLRPASLRCHTAGANGGTFLAFNSKCEAELVASFIVPAGNHAAVHTLGHMEQR